MDMNQASSFAIILILLAVLISTGSAGEMNPQNHPDEQLHLNQTTGSSQPAIPGTQNNDPVSKALPTQGTTPKSQAEEKPGTGTQPVQEKPPVRTQTPTPVMPTSQPTPKAIEENNPHDDTRLAGTEGQDRNKAIPQYNPDLKRDDSAIKVTSNPAGATVLLDGTSKGTTPSSGYLEITDLSPGSYSIRLAKPGFTDYTIEVSLSRNDVFTISADLTSVYVPLNLGSFSVQSSPSQAEVYLDNEYKGITPVSLHDIPAGIHAVLIKMDGYSAYTSTEQIIADQESALSVILTPDVTPTRTPSPLPTEEPAPVPTKSSLSGWIIFCSLAVVGLGSVMVKKSQRCPALGLKRDR